MTGSHRPTRVPGRGRADGHHVRWTTLGSHAGGRAEDARVLRCCLWAGLTVLGVIFASVVPASPDGAPGVQHHAAVERTFTTFSRRLGTGGRGGLGVAGLQPVEVAPPRATDARGPRRTAPPWPGRATGDLWMFASPALCLFLLIWGLAEPQRWTPPATAGDAARDRRHRAAVGLDVHLSGQRQRRERPALPAGRPAGRLPGDQQRRHPLVLGACRWASRSTPTPASDHDDSDHAGPSSGVFDVRCAELCGLLHADMETNCPRGVGQRRSTWLTANGGHS